MCVSTKVYVFLYLSIIENRLLYINEFVYAKNELLVFLKKRFKMLILSNNFQEPMSLFCS